MISQINFHPTGKELRAESTVDLRESVVMLNGSSWDWEAPDEERVANYGRALRVPILASSAIEIIPVQLRSQ